jgi:methyltransferase-like protein
MAQSADERVGRARTLLSFLEASLIEATPYNDLVRAEVAHVLRQSDAYLLHDHLETVNQPVYFRHFAAQARAHGLQVAGDGVLGIRFHDRLDPQAEHALGQLTDDPIEREQYRDVVRNRSIRQTLLCHGDLKLSEQAGGAEVFGPLYLEASLRPAEGPIEFFSDEVQRFVTAGGLRISTGVPVLKAALSHLGNIWPDFITFDDLIAQALAATAPGGEAAAGARDSDVQRLQDNLRQCCYGGVIELHSEPPSFATSVSERPRASALARAQAVKAEVVTNLKHEPIRLEPLDRQVLQRLDGSRDAAGLVDSLCAAATQGQFVVYEQQQLLHDAQQARRVLGDLVPATLQHLARCAFLTRP